MTIFDHIRLILQRREHLRKKISVETIADGGSINDHCRITMVFQRTGKKDQR